LSVLIGSPVSFAIRRLSLVMCIPNAETTATCEGLFEGITIIGEEKLHWRFFR